MNVLITGANGFIGKNLTSQLIEKKSLRFFLAQKNLRKRNCLNLFPRRTSFFT
ncbi:hypothetical protein LEP1GSC043_3521 [Leptospira weilii str. Ecochallenge]|uniref:NAD-dependent epimerase/dehydratase domain-containing protein n=1 Tax=Leptospira weilii str. Ecochallenge TaxID=1049986 RepID=N1UCT6_9LEPT|nr:hypothetical protein LEP1GSC043_3521 [Leptospira weilii str. Ecochallenge]